MARVDAWASRFARRHTVLTGVGIAAMFGFSLVFAPWQGSFNAPNAEPAPAPGETRTSVLQVPVVAVTSCTVTASGLPDARCTPGAADPRVTQATIGQTICVSGYTATVRPSTNVTAPIKYERMIAYGFSDAPANYELDHLISLELGGAPADARNLWPESYLSTPNARTKDHVENTLHEMVCAGQITLAEAQRRISTDWVVEWEREGSR